MRTCGHSERTTRDVEQFIAAYDGTNRELTVALPKQRPKRAGGN
jgi:hypothetical protein